MAFTSNQILDFHHHHKTSSEEEMIADSPPSWNFSTNNFSSNEELLTNGSYDVTTDWPDESTSGYSLGWGDVALVSLFCSIIAGTVAGNTLVIAAVLTTRRLRTVTNCFVMSLAVADWLVGVFVMPPKVALHLVHNEWRLGGIFCELWISLDILLCTASILSLCAISIDRYLAITRPLAYSRRRRSKRLALSMISCVWVAAVVITCPPIFGWYEENRNVEYNCEYNENTGYVVYSALGSFFVPLLVMLYVYARIACVIARRQHSIQKLHNSSDRKSQCYGGSDETEEPLHQRDQERQGSFERGKVETPPSKCSTLQSNLQERPNHQPSRTIWQRLHLKSCTTGDDDASSLGIRSKKSGQRTGLSESDSNSASGIAISLPDPATLNVGIESVSGNGIGSGGNDNLSVRSPSTCSSPGNTSQNQKSQHPSIIRMRTGSRLCHHSISTASPQRNIHRVHQTTSSTTRLFVDNEIVSLESSKTLPLSKSAPRIWTVEETGLCSSGRGLIKSPSERITTGSSLRSTRFNGNSSSLNIPMNNTPAGNPASLMSSPATTTNSTQKCDKNASIRISNRIYHPQSTNSYTNHHHQQMNSIHRGRSIKLTMNLHENDLNQNGGPITREFPSGRVASFKRETKTAQTLAAVVGGFIICWLPFFVAYVIGPFMPSSDAIPTSLMDALIWLGWSNSTINPFIYAFYSADFRSAFWRLTVRKCNTLFQSRDPERRSPRRFDDHTQSRVSG